MNAKDHVNYEAVAESLHVLNDKLKDDLNSFTDKERTGLSLIKSFVIGIVKDIIKCDKDFADTLIKTIEDASERMHITGPLFPQAALTTLNGKEGWMMNGSFYPREEMEKAIIKWNNNPEAHFVLKQGKPHISKNNFSMGCCSTGVEE